MVVVGGRGLCTAAARQRESGVRERTARARGGTAAAAGGGKPVGGARVPIAAKGSICWLVACSSSLGLAELERKMCLVGYLWAGSRT